MKLPIASQESTVKVNRSLLVGALIVLSAATLGLVVALGFQIYLLALIVGIAFLIVGYQWPHLAIWSLVSYTIVEETALRWLPVELRFAGEIAIIFLLGLTIARQILEKGKVRIRRTSIDILLLLFLLTSFLSGLVNDSSLIVFLLGIRPWVRYIGLFYLVTLLDWPVERQKRFFWSLFFLAIIEASLGLLQAVGGRAVATLFAAPDIEFGGAVLQQIDPGIIGTKIFGTMARYDRFGNYLMLMVIFGFTAISIVRRSRQLILAVGTGIIGLGMLLSYSRQAWVGVAIGLSIVIILDKRKYALIAVFSVISILLTVLLVASLPTQSTSGGGATSVVNRLLEPLTEQYWEAQKSTGGRAYYVLVVGPKILEHAPLLGFGPGRFASMVTKAYPTPVYQQLDISRFFYENFALDIQWMAMLGQVGIIGLILFLGIILRLALLALREFYSFGSTTFPGVLALTFVAWSAAAVFISILGPNFEVRAISMYFWLLAGLVTVNSEQLRRRPS